LAQKFGAVDYGMKNWMKTFLKKGPNRSLQAAEAAELRNAPIENICYSIC